MAAREKPSWAAIASKTPAMKPKSQMPKTSQAQKPQATVEKPVNVEPLSPQQIPTTSKPIDAPPKSAPSPSVTPKQERLAAALEQARKQISGFSFVRYREHAHVFQHLIYKNHSL